MASLLIAAVPNTLGVPAAAQTGAESSVAAPSEGAITVMKRKGRRGRSIPHFIDKRGVPVLTNRFSKYRNDPDYVEVRIELDPIFVPGRFRSVRSAREYVSSDIRYLVRRYARQYGLDSNLILAIIKAESDFDPYAVSRAGARGLMQLMPGTAVEMKVRNVFDPAQNIAGGVQYLGKLFKLFPGNPKLALAAYNAGPSTVQKYGGIPPFAETQEYVRRVEGYTSLFARNGLQVALNQKSKARSADFLPQAAGKYLVVLVNGATQPADKVTEDGASYVIDFGGRHYTIRKEHIKSITLAAEASSS